MSILDPKSHLSLPVQIGDDLKTKIRSGRLSAGSRIPSETSLAHQYRVSRITARQALLNLIYEGFLIRVPGKGTFVSEPSERHSGGEGFCPQLLGVIAPTLRNSYFARIVESIGETTGEQGWRTVLFSPTGRAAEERKMLEEAAGVVRGTILIAGEYSAENGILVRKMRETSPLVIVDVAVAGVVTDLVVSDDRTGGRLAVMHLVELGHRKILHLAGPSGDSSADDRLAGYGDALKKHGIPLVSGMVRFTDWSMDQGYFETKKVFLSGGKNRPTAVFACNDEVAVGAFKALAELGLRVPADIAVVGYGNLDVGKYFQVPLTTVDQPAVAIGRAAARLLLERMTPGGGTKEWRKMVIPTTLVIRESCGIRLKGSKAG